MKTENLTTIIMVVMLGLASYLGYGESSMMFTTFAALVASTMGLTELYKKIKNLPKYLIQIGSWTIGIVLALGGWFLDFGFLADITWWESTLYGFGSSLVANSVFDSNTVQLILNAIISIIKKKELAKIEEVTPQPIKIEEKVIEKTVEIKKTVNNEKKVIKKRTPKSL
jgi:lysylphosphatidylglycerol synthetase-like protein (DUF2156 family)